MKVFLDTNVVLDYLTDRAPFADDAEAVIELCSRTGNQAVLTTLSACNIVYILSKYIGKDEAEARLRDLLALLGLVGVDPQSVIDNLAKPHVDFEDSVQISEAERWGADVIVTRDKTGFLFSPIKVKSPSEFVADYLN